MIVETSGTICELKVTRCSLDTTFPESVDPPILPILCGCKKDEATQEQG
jgi:hypothetical protein